MTWNESSLPYAPKPVVPSLFSSFLVKYLISIMPNDMKQTIVDSLKNLQLTKEEEEKDIFISSKSTLDLLEECVLSLFGKLLAYRQQNQHAFKNTLRLAWKMGSNLKIVEVGENIMQFKFSSRCQLEWVERNGPWNFENNLLLLCRWRKGLSSANIVFTHTPLWVQIWGLPFEHMTEEVGRDIGGKIGRVMEVDKRSWQADQAKFIRVRVELPIEKSLRRGDILQIWLGKDVGFHLNMIDCPRFVSLAEKSDMMISIALWYPRSNL